MIIVDESYDGFHRKDVLFLNKLILSKKLYYTIKNNNIIKIFEIYCVFKTSINKKFAFPLIGCSNENSSES